MRKEIVDWHVDQLMEEQKNHGGDLIVTVVYSDQEGEEHNGFTSARASQKLLALTSLELSEQVEVDTLVKAAMAKIKGREEE